MSITRQLQPDEQVLYRAHPSRVVLLPLLALGAVLVLGGFALRGFTGNDWALYVPAALGGVALLLAGARHLALNANEYVLTDHRVLRQTGLLAKSSMDIYLDKINNVEHRQTLWGRLLNFEADKPFVHRLAARLDKSHFHTWLDEHDLIAGDPLPESIGRALQAVFPLKAFHLSCMKLSSRASFFAP